ncbi:alpha/beta fold hydrolase [Buchnera aphidicola]|uniref:Alpha/beta fold hydrolase n=1 Tax=Buchnera aphidicola subsp. Rhopalosiphum maidis TaxID=118109 RepID=A0A3G2I5B7_BUCRM|nr:alpha/beta fold hydrolase [Buchnera aphidicola]AYN24547.1 alpha/beta fold hydrolase [Buchnera aphidicola (Rhopalosiphum maidis)]
MKNFYWTTVGNGNINVILLNGWGFNSKIWFFIVNKLNSKFKFHIIDLPGMGLNKHLFPLKIDEITEVLYHYMPKNAVWLGWSIGGLVANKFASLYPENILGIINVASSPCFIKKKMARNRRKKNIPFL